MLATLGEKNNSPPAPTPPSKPQTPPHLHPTRRVKMTRLRMRVSERLKGAQNTYAMLTTFNEIDMSGLMELRNKYKVGRRACVCSGGGGLREGAWGERAGVGGGCACLHVRRPAAGCGRLHPSPSTAVTQ